MRNRQERDGVIAEQARRMGVDARMLREILATYYRIQRSGGG